MTSRRPTGLGSRGRRLWRDVMAEFDLSLTEGEILGEAARTADLIERLAKQLAAEQLVVDGSRGQAVVNPLAAELRQQRELLGRLISRLALPDADEIDNAAAAFGRRGAAARWHRRPTPKRGT
jgi:hypothetical protein